MAIDTKIIYGYVEKATLVDKNMTVSAKLDTGAKSASLSAVDVHEIERDGKPFLVFKVPDKNREEEFTAEYVGKVHIKARVGEHTLPNSRPQPITRPVVRIQIKIGDKVRFINVNLTNRKRFNYPLLLGRDAIIAFDGLIDPANAFLTRTEKADQHAGK